LLAVFEVETPTDSTQEITQIVEGHEVVRALEVLRWHGEKIGLQFSVNGREHVTDRFALRDAQIGNNFEAHLIPIGLALHQHIQIAKVGFVGVKPGNAKLTLEFVVQVFAYLTFNLEVLRSRFARQVVEVSAHAVLKQVLPFSSWVVWRMRINFQGVFFRVFVVSQPATCQPRHPARTSHHPVSSRVPHAPIRGSPVRRNGFVFAKPRARRSLPHHARRRPLG
jgi:hypothetical protein